MEKLHGISVPEGGFYAKLAAEAKALIDGEDDLIANAANVASLVFHALNERQPNTVNWVGFYFVRGTPPILVLGPFQGKIACLRIPKGRGVCGGAWERRETLLVKARDVHEFPGHIACDSASNSEIVVPIISPVTNEVVGVFDIDSPTVNGLNEEDSSGLAAIATILAMEGKWEQLGQSVL